MSEVKWIKITTDVFDNWKIKHLKAIPELGHTFVCIWFELLCMAGSCNEHGMLMMSNRIVATDELIAETFHEDIKVIQMALKTFESLYMIEVTANDAIQITNWHEYQNADKLSIIKEYEAERKAKSREKQKQLQLEEKNVPDNVPDKSRDSSISYYININNINNTINILNNNKYKDKYIYINNNNVLKDSILEWMSYKDSCKPKSKHHYGSEMGILKLLTQIQSKAEDRGVDYVVACIDNSIAHTWQGITWLDNIEVKKALSDNYIGPDEDSFGEDF